MSLAKLKLKQPSSYLGIDASTYSYAFGLIVDGELRRYGIIKYAGKDRFERLVDSHYKVKALMQELGHIDVITQEQAVGSINQKTGLFLAQAYGATICTAFENCDEYNMVNPNEWQAALGVKAKTPAAIKKDFPDATKSWLSEEARKERKRRNIDWVNNKFNINLTYDQNDTADAIGIAWWSTQQ